jgi:hypothetical protein
MTCCMIPLVQAPGHLLVRLGEWDARSHQEPHPYQELPVQRIIIHPDFYPGALFYDIALIVLVAGADFSRSVPNDIFESIIYVFVSEGVKSETAHEQNPFIETLSINVLDVQHLSL